MLAARCVTMVSRISLTVTDGAAVTVSISAGATLVRSGDAVEELICRADALMYQSKTSGRDRATTE